MKTLGYDVYTHIMILRIRMMRIQQKNREIKYAMIVEQSIRNEIVDSKLCKHNKSVLKRNSVATWERKFDLFTRNMENFWTGRRKRREKEKEEKSPFYELNLF